MSDWTGSAGQRKSQGDCRPPSKVRRNLTSDVIPAGTPVRTKKNNGNRWFAHRTKKTLRVENIQRRTRKSVIFDFDGWVIAVALKHIRSDAQG